jgi:hypothetical protein
VSTRSARFPLVAAIAPTLLALVAGCELTEVTIAENDDVVVAEVLVQVRDDGVQPPGPPSVFALLHRTSGAPEGVRGAAVTIRTPRRDVQLSEATPLNPCAFSTPPDYGTTCYRVFAAAEPLFAPGDLLQLEIRLPDGGRLAGSVRVPGDFHLIGAAGAPTTGGCRLAPDSTFDLRWSRSEGAWAYVAETALEDFRAGYAARGIEVEEDSLYLMGLATSAADTSIVFPREFGLLERLLIDRELLVALQKGLPAGAFGPVTVAAVERNYTNWARGGTFNPSGQVRIPSLRGDGTGFFGAAVVRRITVVVPPSQRWPGGGATLPPCG